MSLTPTTCAVFAAYLHDEGVTVATGETMARMLDTAASLNDAQIDAALAEVAALMGDSWPLLRHFYANPHNLPNIAKFPPLNPHDACAARFEAEGRAGHANGRNPYNPGTMANTRWAMGWHQVQAANDGFY